MKTNVVRVLTILVAVGAILIGNLIQTEAILSTLFLWFFATIILLQAIPAILLFCVSVRGIFESQQKADVDLGEEGKRGD